MATVIGPLLLVAGAALAAPPLETVQGRIQVVNAASRTLRTDGVDWDLSSTAVVQVPGVTRASLRDLRAGMNVILGLAPAGDGEPVVS